MIGLLGFTGKPNSGKSTAARYISEKHGIPWINVGDSIKEMLGAYYRCRGLQEKEIARRLHGDLKEQPDHNLGGKTPRHAMQSRGKECRDLISPFLFVDCWADRVAAAGGSAVADGMRHADEMGAFKKLDGILVHIVRPVGSIESDHIAEQLQLKPDTTIVNDGTIDDLLKKIDQLIIDVGWARAA